MEGDRGCWGLGTLCDLGQKCPVYRKEGKPTCLPLGVPGVFTRVDAGYDAMAAGEASDM